MQKEQDESNICEGKRINQNSAEKQQFVREIERKPHYLVPVSFPNTELKLYGETLAYGFPEKIQYSFSKLLLFTEGQNEFCFSYLIPQQ